MRPREQHQRRTDVREPQCNAAPDAGGRAGNDRHLAREIQSSSSATYLRLNRPSGTHLTGISNANEGKSTLRIRRFSCAVI